MTPIRYSVVVPVYNNAATIPELVRQLDLLARDRDGSLEVVFVVDGSPDNSLEVLRECLEQVSLCARIVPLTRNFGSFSAIRIGLRLSRGDFIAVMAADLQEPPEVVAEFLDVMDAGTADIVMGRRVGRADPVLSSAASRLYWSAYRKLINREVPSGGVDVFGCTREVALVIGSFNETHTSLVGLLFWVGYRRTFVDYQRLPRASGSSGWTARKKMRYLLDSVYSFTDLPVVVLSVVGLVGVVVACVLAVVVVVGWATGVIGVAGYTALMIVLLGSSSAILLGLGVVGSYVWRSYENGKQRPYALIGSTQEYRSRGDSQ